MAFERERKTPVLAITDEPGETLDGFFGAFGKPFPERVATDELRRSFLAYGVSGTPTFVLVDGDGVIRPEEIVREFPSLDSTVDVYAALVYYADHKAEIEADFAEDQRLAADAERKRLEQSGR